MIYYRYHPYHGEVVTVRGCTIHGGEQIAIVLRQNGELKNIPAWMIEPQAAQLDVHEPPRFSRQCLNELRHFVSVALSAFDAAATSTDQDGGAE